MPKTVIAVALVAAGAVVGWLAHTPASPAIHCPTVDSCQVDYHSDAWWLRTFDASNPELPGPWVRISE
jgi:hypothetical protein